MGYTLDQFTNEVDWLTRREKDPQVIVEQVQRLLQQLLELPNWLDYKYRQPVSGKPYSQYLLYTPSDEAWSVVSFAWPTGSKTPVHDHCTWGVVGVYQGEETETTYRPIEGSVVSGRVRVVEQRTAVLGPGGLTNVVPPDDIHRVSNNGDVVAVSVHVYGANIGKHPRHIIDQTTGEVKGFISGYDNPQ